jgi:hypothetical protein
MKKIAWNFEKAEELRNNAVRGNVSFEDCVVALEGGKLLDVAPNPSNNHASQKMFVLNINNYAYCVPFVESVTEIFLKTVFPSRKYTALYLTEDDNDQEAIN